MFDSKSDNKSDTNRQIKLAEGQAAPAHAYQELGVRRFGRFNWLGLWTLYRKEVQRFLKVWMQTLMALSIV